MTVASPEIARGADTAHDAITVTAWTMLSRVVGFAKVAVIGAVLGPTFFGNAFQFINSLPNFIFYGFLAGSLFASLLVPALVGHIDRGERAAAERIAGGFLGLSLAMVALAVPFAIIIGPALLEVSGGSTDQLAASRLLVVLVVPQVFGYALVGTGSSAMNASRRFALAAAAPAVESLATIGVVGLCAALYGVTDEPSTGELLLLGLGSTGAVALHAGLQWFGARRAGLTVVPRAGWRDNDVRTLARRALPALGQAGLMAFQTITLLVLANRIAGGVVAFQIALNFYFLAIALCATPAALSVLPRLARWHEGDDAALFGRSFETACNLALFLAIPVAVSYAFLAGPIASAVSFGRMTEDGGATMVQAALVPLALAVIGQTVFAISSYACYARKDPLTPLRAMAGQAAVCLLLGAISLLLHGAAVSAALGTAFAVSVVGSGGWLAARLRRRAGFAKPHLRRGVADALLGAAIMIGPAWATSHYGAALIGTRGALCLAALVAAAVFFAVERAIHAEALSLLLAGLHPLRAKPVVSRG